MVDYQRTKSASWHEGASADDKINCVKVVFTWCRRAYHEKFRDLANYDGEYDVLLGSNSTRHNW